MKNKYIWPVGSFIIALSLVLASCSAASTSSTSSTLSTSQTAAVTTTATPKTAIEVAASVTTATTASATTAASESQPQYGGDYTLALTAQQTSFDTDITSWGGYLIEHLTHNTLIGGDLG